MNKKIAKRWVAVLRSGKYKKGKEKLRDAKNQFCCLGVLCELAVASKVIKKPELKDGRYYYAGQMEWLPRQVIKWAEIGDNGGRFGDDRSLVDLNDGYGGKPKPFKSIATIIEKNVEKL